MVVSGLTEFELWSKGGWPRVEVAGEFYHQAEIRSLLPPDVAEGGVEVETTAHLIPEPTNEYDRHAVRVEVQGRLIGYLPKEVAPGYGPVLGALVERGLAPTTACRIWAYERDEWKGSDRSGNDIYERVLSAQATVVLDAPHRIVPMNIEPSGPHRTLPHGGALQVRGEEKHLDVLAPWVARDGEGWIYAELRTIEVSAGKSSKVLVELTLDGEVIGELTPAMSAHFVPAIEHCASQGSSVVAKALLKGNAMKVEAVLHAAKAHELDARWMTDVASQNREAPAESNGIVAVGEERASAAPTTVGDDFYLPPRPSRIVFNPPPGWPPAPSEWVPPPGWKPAPDWLAPPSNWQFWTLA